MKIELSDAVKAEQSQQLKYTLKTLKLFRKQRNEFINECENDAWKSWANTPIFWSHWSIANIPSSKIKIVTDILMNNQKVRTKFPDVAQLIIETYTNPMKWIGPEFDGGEFSFKNMLAKHGQPA